MNKQAPLSYIHSIDSSFAKVPSKTAIAIRAITPSDFETQKKNTKAPYAEQIAQSGFAGKDKQVCILRDDKGSVVEIWAGVAQPLSIYSFAHIHEKIRGEFSGDFLKGATFKLETELSPQDATQATIGWALAGYRFDLFKKDKGKTTPVALVWPENADQKKTKTMVESLCLIKTLINIPANVLGTDELADAAKSIADLGGAKFSKIVDKDLLSKNFPMIYDVGKASPRRPQLVEFTWGDSKNPLVTLVGKGIVFDTGGLDLKPPPFMLLMKKDMGGSAHVLALSHYIMSMKLPIRLRVLIAVAENSVGGESFRPGDVLQTRKGLTVEVSDTDAEGRLVVGDALTYASEGDKPELIIDFCTLTGSARAALGYDIPAFFSNRDTLLDELKNLGIANEDPVWPLPLWQPYLKEMNSSVADLNNIGSGKAGAIHGGLFLEQFVDPKIDWIHVDCYAWEQSGKAGRPAGGADTGMRAVLKLIEKRFAA